MDGLLYPRFQTIIRIIAGWSWINLTFYTKSPVRLGDFPGLEGKTPLHLHFGFL